MLVYLLKNISMALKWHTVTEETKKKIWLANRWIWIKYKCDNCWKDNEEKQSHFNKKKRHFCDIKCYSEFRKTKLPFNEQHAYKWIWKNSGDSKKQAHKRWKQKNKEKWSFLQSTRRKSERGAEWKHTFEEWIKLKEKYNHTCLWCWKIEPNIKLTRDHIIPLSEWWNNYISNIQPLCRSCNSRKWKKLNYIYENPDLMASIANNNI